jgi:hypothetical protein
MVLRHFIGVFEESILPNCLWAALPPCQRMNLNSAIRGRRGSRADQGRLWHREVCATGGAEEQIRSRKSVPPEPEHQAESGSVDINECLSASLLTGRMPRVYVHRVSLVRQIYEKSASAQTTTTTLFS